MIDNPYFSDFIDQRIRCIENWPKPGVSFRDITPALQDPACFRRMVDGFIHRYCEQSIDALACIDARGFIIGGAMAYEMNIPLIPIRKKGKLPFDTISESYALEYGEAEVEMHIDAVKAGQRVLLMDDLIATGGTMAASAKLVQRQGGEVIEAACIIDLPALGGSAALKGLGIETFSLCRY